jgi:hypothetical protein
MRINFEVSDEEYFKFREIVGKGNMSDIFREFISRMIIGNIEESELKKSLNDKKNIQKSIDIDIKTIEMKINNITKEKEKVEKEQKEKENEKMNIDPFAHLSGKSKINEAQICLYRIEKGKFLPEWAKKEPNQKEYALKVINNIIKKTKR